MWRQVGQWPLLLGAVVCLALGVWLVSRVPNGALGAAIVLLTLGALLLGAFLARLLLTGPR